jgi:subtilisin family serine protease
VNAPGSRIYSTWPVSLSKGGDPYRAISGTSMATPYVAGVAALLKANAKDPKDVDQEFVRAYLSKGLVDEPTAKKKSGTGRVDLYGTAYAYSRDYLKSSLAGAVPPSGEPKAVDVPGLPAEEGGGAVGNVWDLLCAL